MGSAKKPQTPAKADGKTAAQRHHTSSPTSPFTPTKTPSSRKKAPSTPKPWSHIPPRQDEKSKNGRHEGRNLITWTREFAPPPLPFSWRLAAGVVTLCPLLEGVKEKAPCPVNISSPKGPRMAEKLLLHLQYECSRYKIDLPWDSIAHRLHPGSSGGAVLQHVNRLRNTLVAEGHLVPPICQKPGSRVTVDPKIRGYVRKHMEGVDTVSTRAVPFTEPMDDRKFNLPDAYDNVHVSGHVKRQNQGGAPRKNGGSRGTPVIKSDSPDPADLDSDAEYDPQAKKNSDAFRRRSARPKVSKSYIEEDNEYEEPGEDDDGEIEEAEPDMDDVGDPGDGDEGIEVGEANEDDEADEADETDEAHEAHEAHEVDESSDAPEEEEADDEFEVRPCVSRPARLGTNATNAFPV